MICRSAPQVIITYSPTAYTIGAKDAVIAASHLELLLPSFGLGGCWAGYLMVALQQYPEAKKAIGLDDKSTVHAALLVGYPKYKYTRVPVRKESFFEYTTISVPMTMMITAGTAQALRNCPYEPL